MQKQKISDGNQANNEIESKHNNVESLIVKNDKTMKTNKEIDIEKEKMIQDLLDGVDTTNWVATTSNKSTTREIDIINHPNQSNGSPIETVKQESKHEKDKYRKGRHDDRLSQSFSPSEEEEQEGHERERKRERERDDNNNNNQIDSPNAVKTMFETNLRHSRGFDLAKFRSANVGATGTAGGGVGGNINNNNKNNNRMSRHGSKINSRTNTLDVDNRINVESFDPNDIDSQDMELSSISKSDNQFDQFDHFDQADNLSDVFDDSNVNNNNNGNNNGHNNIDNNTNNRKANNQRQNAIDDFLKQNLNDEDEAQFVKQGTLNQMISSHIFENNSNNNDHGYYLTLRQSVIDKDDENLMDEILSL